MKYLAIVSGMVVGFFCGLWLIGSYGSNVVLGSPDALSQSIMTFTGIIIVTAVGGFCGYKIFTKISKN